MKSLVALGVLAGALLFPSTAHAAVQDEPGDGWHGGCTRGDVCFYTKWSGYYKSGIGRGENNDWTISSTPYGGIEGIFNNGNPETLSAVRITYVGYWGDEHKICVLRKEVRTIERSSITHIRWITQDEAVNRC